MKPDEVYVTCFKDKKQLILIYKKSVFVRLFWLFIINLKKMQMSKKWEEINFFLEKIA